MACYVEAPWMALVKAKVGSQRSGSCRKDRAMMGTRTRNSQMEGTVIARINPAVSAIAGNSRQVVSPTVGSFKEFKGPKGPMGWDSFAWKIPRREGDFSDAAMDTCGYGIVVLFSYRGTSLKRKRTPL